MKLTMRLDLGDGEFTVTTNLYTIVVWERKYKRKISQIAEGLGIEDLSFLAYEACKQNSVLVPAMLDDFIKKLVTLEIVESEPTNPTEAAHTDIL